MRAGRSISWHEASTRHTCVSPITDPSSAARSDMNTSHQPRLEEIPFEECLHLLGEGSIGDRFPSGSRRVPDRVARELPPCRDERSALGRATNVAWERDRPYADDGC